jgi:hypothetical protein
MDHSSDVAGCRRQQRDTPAAPVSRLKSSATPTERRFYGQLLSAIGVPFAPRATILDLEVQALRNLRRMAVKLLMLDEVRNVLAGGAKKQRILLGGGRRVRPGRPADPQAP